jgi:hypothetical protein
MPKFTREELDEIKKNTELVEEQRKKKQGDRKKRAARKKRKSSDTAPINERLVAIALLGISIFISYLVMKFS